MSLGNPSSDEDSQSDYYNDSFDEETIEEVYDDEEEDRKLAKDPLVASFDEIEKESAPKEDPKWESSDVEELPSEGEEEEDLDKSDEELKNTAKETTQKVESAPEEVEYSETEEAEEDVISEHSEEEDTRRPNITIAQVEPIQSSKCDIRTPSPAEDSTQQEESEYEEDEDRHEVGEDIQYEISSSRPHSYDSEHALHLNFIKRPSKESISSNKSRTRNSNRKSLSFSNERMREIERHNNILLQRILTQKSSYEHIVGRKQFVKKPTTEKCPRQTTSAVNRKKQQRQIDSDNLVLKRKIEEIAQRRPRLAKT